MKLVYILKHIQLGGITSVLITRLNYISQNHDFEIHIITEFKNDLIVLSKFNSNIKFHCLEVNKYFYKYNIPLISSFFLINKIKKVYEKKIKEISPDIITTFGWGYYNEIIPTILPEIKKIKEFHNSFTSINIIAPKPKNILRKIVAKFRDLNRKSTDKGYDLYVTLTERDKNDRIHITENIHVIPNAIINLSSNEQKKINSKSVIAVGTLTKNKNFEDQILVWSKIIKMYPDWNLHIYGEGNEKDNLKKLIVGLHLENNVFLEGKTYEINTKYKESEFLISTSLSEGLPMVVIEAMNFHLPVIAYDCPCGPNEIITDNEDGFLVTINRIDVITDKIINMIEDKQMRDLFSLKAYNKSKNYFIENIAKDWIKIYNELLVKEI